MNKFVNVSAGPTKDSKTLYLEAKNFYSSRKFREAIFCLARLLGDESYSLRANTNIASCLLQMGLPRAALKFTERALQEDPSFLLALSVRIKAFFYENKHDKVDQLCEKYIANCTSDDEIWNHWTISLRAIQQDERALDIVRNWLSFLPDSTNGLILEGELLSDFGNNHQAIVSLGKALSLGTNLERAYSSLSVVMMRTRRYEDALQYVNKAIEINPNSLNYCCRKALALWLTGDWRDAANWYGKVSKMDPNSAIYLLNHYLVLPGIPASIEEIDEARMRYNQGLDIAEKNSSLKLDFNDEAIPLTFELAYHNHNDRELLERYFSLMRRLSLPHIERVAESCRFKLQDAEVSRNGRVRIGFASRFFSGHSNTIAFSGLIRNLDKDNFRLTIIHLPDSKQDHVRDSLDQICDESICLNSDLIESGMILKSLNLDILFFTDLGMNANDYFLPFLRTAPIQMTGWGIPHTSGIQEIDYYLSVEGLEPCDAGKLYTEKLVKLPGRLPCCFDTTDLNFTPLPREYFFLPPDLTLIGCLQGLHKLHPDFDFLLERIAKSNPDVAFVFIEDSISSRTKIFLERLSVNAPSVRERCILLAMMGRGEYHALCDCMDVLLDPIYYGCGITFFEATYVGTPIVTLEGDTLRSRVVASGYREMNLDDPPIVANDDEYVDLVTNLCNDANRRLSIKSSILEKNYLIFNRIDHVRNFEQFCLGIVRQHSSDFD